MVFPQVEFLDVLFRVGFALAALQDGLDPQQEFFRIEGFGDVIVGAEAESLEDIILHGLCRQEDDGHLSVFFPNLLSQGKAVLLGHHHIKDAKIVFALAVFFQALHSICSQGHIVVMHFQVRAEHIAKILVVFN